MSFYVEGSSDEGTPCCTAWRDGGCCGAGSVCCQRAGPHFHVAEEVLSVGPGRQPNVDVTAVIRVAEEAGAYYLATRHAKAVARRYYVAQQATNRASSRLHSLQSQSHEASQVAAAKREQLLATVERELGVPPEERKWDE